MTFCRLLNAPGGRDQTHCAVAHPIYVSNSRTKFGWIWSNGLEGDSVTDRQLDGQIDKWTDKPFGPSPGPQGAGPKHCAVAHPIHVSKSHTNLIGFRLKFEVEIV